MMQSKHKRKPEKGQGLTVILETKIHNFDVKVEVTGIFSYYDVFHKLIFLHDMYRSTSKSLDSEYKIGIYLFIHFLLNLPVFIIIIINITIFIN